MAEEKMFPVVFRGYDVEAVKGCIENKDGEIEKLKSEIEEAKHRISELEEELEKKDVISKDLGDMFLTAQTAADQYLAEAKARADAALNEAEEKAEQILKEAEEKRESVLSQTQEEARIIREHVMKKKVAVDRIVESVLKKMEEGYEEIAQFSDHTKERLKQKQEENKEKQNG